MRTQHIYAVVAKLHYKKLTIKDIADKLNEEFPENNYGVSFISRLILKDLGLTTKRESKGYTVMYSPVRIKELMLEYNIWDDNSAEPLDFDDPSI